MYNRYVPQPDGSYRRNYVPDKKAAPPPAPECPPTHQEKKQDIPQPPNPSGAGFHPRKNPPPPKKGPCKTPRHTPVDTFLQQLLPAEFDTGDLMIVLLLLLMAGDSPDNRNHALLTLALYFFL